MKQMTRSFRRGPGRITLVAACLVAAMTCSGLDNLSISAEGQAVIPQRSVLDEILGNLSFTGFNGFDISQSQEFRNQGYSKEQIDSVRMERFSLAIESPEDGNFDFLDSIRFYANAEGQPEVLIAEIDPVPEGVAALELDVDPTVELQPYVVAPSVTITTRATGLRPPEETVVDAEAVFDVDVNVTGGCE